METKNVLRDHSGAICFGLALIASLIFAVHMAISPLAPIADGAGYATRTFALYGFLHSGQWSAFWNLLVRPHQSICPLHCLLFFLLPERLAGLQSYFALQYTTTYLLLAFAVFKITDVLERREWAPFIFILCAVNNVALTDFYAFYLDMPFLALGLFVLALQLVSWSRKTPRASLLAGFSLGLLFLVKPANALILLSTYILSEIFHAAFAFRSVRRGKDRSENLRHLSAHAGWVLLGFAPIFGLAVALGSAQSILLLIDQNEVQQAITPLAAQNLTRLFYFPLCLSAYYHVLILCGLLVAFFCLGKWFLAEGRVESGSVFPARLFLPVLVSYLLLGEFFSFWVHVKALRSLLLLLPLFWILIAWLWEKQGVRTSSLLVAALIYASLAYSQKTFDLFHSKGQLLEDNYQLAGSSWNEFPSAWRRGLSLNQVICDLVGQRLPPRQVICINSIELRNSLAWHLDNQDLLAGRDPQYQVRNLFDYKGGYFYHSLIGSNLLVLITFFPAQPSKLSWLETSEFLDYASAKWSGANGVARIREMPLIQQRTIGYQIAFAHPLDRAEVDRANASAFGNLTKSEGYGAESLYGRRYSSAEAASLLHTWWRERF